MKFNLYKHDSVLNDFNMIILLSPFTGILFKPSIISKSRQLLLSATLSSFNVILSPTVFPIKKLLDVSFTVP